MEEMDVTMAELEQLLQRLVIPRLDALDRQLDHLAKRLDVIEAELQAALGRDEGKSAGLRVH